MYNTTIQNPFYRVKHPHLNPGLSYASFFARRGSPVFSFHRSTDVTLSSPFFPIISKPLYCPVIAPSSPLSSDSPIRRRLSGAESALRAPWLALLLQLPILHMETWLVSVVLCKAPSFYVESCHLATILLYRAKG